MSEPKEIKKEDLEKFISNQSQINRLVSSLGEITFELETLQAQKNETIQSINQIRTQSQTHFKEFEKENGPGTIDLEKGLFTPLPTA